jgi:NAD(P)-dependent dehydrogenase (short-subunit alcohol dehydrogenase family)
VDVAGRVAIVTGGSAGIGRAVAESLRSEGATVIVADVSEPEPVDMSSPEDVRRLFARLDRLDILVNNAGGVFETWQKTIDVNLGGLVLATQLAFDAMDGDGVIVNVSSVAGLGLEPYDAPDYAAAKAAVVRLTASLANHDGVRVTCVCPDWVDTPAVRQSLAELTDAERARVPPLVPADEIAGIVLELVRDDSAAGRVVVRWAHEDGPRTLS